MGSRDVNLLLEKERMLRGVFLASEADALWKRYNDLCGIASSVRKSTFGGIKAPDYYCTQLSSRRKQYHLNRDGLECRKLHYDHDSAISAITSGHIGELEKKLEILTPQRRTGETDFIPLPVDILLQYAPEIRAQRIRQLFPGRDTYATMTPGGDRMEFHLNGTVEKKIRLYADLTKEEEECFVANAAKGILCSIYEFRYAAFAELSEINSKRLAWDLIECSLSDIAGNNNLYRGYKLPDKAIELANRMHDMASWWNPDNPRLDKRISASECFSHLDSLKDYHEIKNFLESANCFFSRYWTYFMGDDMTTFLK